MLAETLLSNKTRGRNKGQPVMENPMERDNGSRITRNYSISLGRMIIRTVYSIWDTHEYETLKLLWIDLEND